MMHGRSIRIKEIEAKRGLGKSNLPELDYTLNPYLGCLHGCIYCYAINFTADREASLNWGEVVAVRKNIIEKLKHDAQNLKKGVVGLSTITDPYQPIEAKYRLSRESLEILLSKGFRVSIQTKSPLVLRDLDILLKYKQRVDVGFTVTTMDSRISRLIEPYTPSPLSRAKALEKLNENGIETWIFLGPILPGINDAPEQIEAVLDLAKKTKSRVIYDTFARYSGAIALMRRTIGEESVSRILGSLRKDWKENIFSYIDERCREKGVKRTSAMEDWVFEKGKLQKTLF